MAVNAVRRSPQAISPAREELVRLADGRDLVIRPIRPEDAGPIAASFHLLHEDEIRRRFLHILKALSEEHLQQLTRPSAGAEFVVVAAEPLPAGEALVAAVARLARDTGDGQRAEFGILVSHFVTGMGLGKLLLQRLIEWSQQGKVRELWGDVMDDNTAMLELAAKLGFHRESVLGSQGLIRITLRLSVPVR